jgi:exopolysaccharide biosynthesis predicted pyruvyltransferase EpsI
MSRKPLNIAILRPFGGNVGNHVINRSVKYLLKNQNPFDELNIIDIPASKKLDSGLFSGLDKNSVFYLNEVADGIIIGGGNLFENGEVDAEPVALRALRPPLMLFSNSLGRIIGRHDNYIDRSDSSNTATLKELHDTSRIALARDSSTVKVLADRHGCVAELGWCPTIHTDVAYGPLLPTTAKSKKIYISIRNPDRISGSDFQKYRVTNAIEELILLVSREYGAEAIILCNDLRDLKYAMYLNKRYNTKFEYTADDVEFVTKLKSAKLVFSFRLHTTIPCVALGTNVLNFSYDERAECLISDLELNNQSVTLTNIKPEDICFAVKEKLKNENITKPIIWKKISKYQKEKLSNFMSLAHRYQSNGY